MSVGATACGHSQLNSSISGASVTEAVFGRTDAASFHEQERLIARCMKRSGFKYYSRVRAGEVPAAAVSADGDLDEKKFAKKFGFGIATLAVANPVFTSNPNEKVESMLSVADKLSYRTALFGSAKSGLPDPASCFGTAQRQTQGDETKAQRLQQGLDRARRASDNTESAQKSLEAWSDCVQRKSGYQAKTPEAAVTIITERYNEVFADGPLLADLASEEINLASASSDCAPLLAGRIEAQKRAGLGFLSKNKNELGSLRDSAIRVIPTNPLLSSEAAELTEQASMSALR